MTYAEADRVEQTQNEHLHRAKIVGLLLLFVLLVIAIYAVLAHRDPAEKLTAAALCVLLAIGIVTQILLTRRIKSTGDTNLAVTKASLAAALARATSAERDVLKLKTPRRTILS